MVSEEFKKNVESKDLVTVRSALVDYLIIDKSFRTFDEALDYAEENLGVIEPLQADEIADFEKNPDAWNESYLNKQKVALMVCFSQERIDHLKAVITRVLGSEASKTNANNSEISKNSGSSIKRSESKTGITRLSEKVVNHSAEDERSYGHGDTTTQRSPESDKMIRESNSSNNKTGRRVVGVKEIKANGTEEKARRVGLAEKMIVGGAAIAAIGCVTAGVGVAIAEPAVVTVGITTAFVGEGVIITGGIAKIVKNA